MSESTVDRTTETCAMPTETLTALQGSIAKWQAIAAGTGKDEGPDNCPLCQRFYLALAARGSDDGPCDGCPVKEATGEWGCGGTPYEDVWSPLISKRTAFSKSRPYAETPEEKAAAQQEVDFLKSLLPPGVES